MKASEIEDSGENEVSVPKIVRLNAPIIGGGLGKITSKFGGKVRNNEIFMEKKRSDNRFKELQLNGTKIYLLNSKGDIVETTSKMCGDDEYIFTLMDGILRIWKGGVSVFEDGSKDILFHRPHMIVEFNSDGYPVVSDIHNFEIIPLLRIFNAIGLIEKIFGKDE